MSNLPTPKCPVGHTMKLFQVAAGGWRYGCTRCATSFKSRKGISCGWLSPIKSTKERAAEAAMKCTPKKLLTLEEVKERRTVWIEDTCCDYGNELFPAIFKYRGYPHSSVFIADTAEGYEDVWYDNERYGIDWRCWTSCPTDKESEAAKWEELAE